MLTVTSSRRRFIKLASVTLGVFSLGFLNLSSLSIFKPQKVEAIASLEPDTSLADADATFLSENDYDESGVSVSSAGDVNNDGYNDFLIGADSAEKTYLILGKASGWNTDISLSEADASFLGESSSDFSGKYVSAAGDVNNDGYDDFLIAAPGNDDGGLGAGKTYLILGRSTEEWSTDVDLVNADASFIGENANDQSGDSISTAGDVNNDGYDDFIIGADGNDDGGLGAGKAYLILGRSTEEWGTDVDLVNADASFIGENADDRSGTSVAFAGDVNNDGYSDFLIGAPMNDDSGNAAGKTYLILGKTSGWTTDVSLEDADVSFLGEGEAEFEESGFNVSGAGDVNNDGYDDFLIVASEFGDDLGKIYLILGKSTEEWDIDVSLSDADGSFVGENAGDGGETISAAGDVNSDGYGDFLIGSSCYPGGGYTGKTYLILGKNSVWGTDIDLSEADASFVGENEGDESGWSVAGVGDVNGDGADDILIGAEGYPEGDYTGKTYLILGPTYNIINLTPTLTPVPTLDWTTDLTVNGRVGTFEVGIENASYRIATFNINLDQDLDWVDLTADSSDYKAFLHYPDHGIEPNSTNGDSSYSPQSIFDLPGISGGGFTLYVPKGNSTEVGICPGATSLAEVNTNCAGIQYFHEGEEGVTVATEDGVTYWKVPFLVGTGGFSMQQELVRTGSNIGGIVFLGIVLLPLSLAPFKLEKILSKRRLSIVKPT